LSPDLLTLDRQRVGRIRVKQADGEEFAVEPVDDGEGFRLGDLQEGETLRSDYVLEDLVDRVTDLKLEDVRPVNEIAWPATPALRLEITQADGLTIRVSGARIDDTHWLRLDAFRGQPADPSESSIGGAATVAQEAARLNRAWQGRAYAVADWVYDILAKRRTDLLTDKAEAVEDAEEAAPTAPSG
jgi:hypothetical protein